MRKFEVSEIQNSLMVLCLSLTRRADRRFVIENTLGSVLGESIKFVDAIDGKSVSKTLRFGYPADMPISSYAVRLGKRIALRKFLQSDSNFLLFLEDDVAVTLDFEDTIDRVMNLDVDVVFLGGEYEELPQVWSQDKRWMLCRGIRNNHAVLFNRQGAKKVQTVLKRRNKHWSDGQISSELKNDWITALCPPEMVAFQRLTKSDNSGNGGNASPLRNDIGDLPPDAAAALDAVLNCTNSTLLCGAEDNYLIMFIIDELSDVAEISLVSYSSPISENETQSRQSASVKSPASSGPSEKCFMETGVYDLLVVRENLSHILFSNLSSKIAHSGLLLISCKFETLLNLISQDPLWRLLFSTDNDSREDLSVFRKLA